MPNMKFMLLLVLFCSWTVLALCDLRFNDERFSNRTLYAAQIFHPPYLSDLFEPITGPLVWSGATNNYTGFIVHFRRLDKPIFWETARDLQNQGAIGIIAETNTIVAGQAFCTYNGEDFLADVTIPFVSVSLYGWEDIIERLVAGEIINATLSSDGNAWYDIYYSLEFAALFRGMLTVVASGLVIYGSVILAFFIRAQGSQFNVPQVCIGLEIVSNLFRLVFFSVDPFGCFFKFQSLAASILQTFSAVFELVTFALIMFYWYEAINEASIAIYPFLKRLQIPLYVIMFTLIAFDLLASCLMYFIGMSDLTKVIVYSAFNLAFFIFYTVMLVKVGKRMKKSADLTNNGKKVTALKQVNNKMILNGVVRLVELLFVIGIGPTVLLEYPVARTVLFSILYILFMLDSFCRIYLFNYKKAAKSSTTNRTNASSRNSALQNTHTN